MTARETILRAWWSARRAADAHGVLSLDARAFAGYALERADGDVPRAATFVPAEIESFWSQTRDALEQVAIEERRPASVLPAADLAVVVRR